MEIDYDVPAGKISLRTALELLSKHQQDPQTNSAAVLASEHQLDQADMQKVYLLLNFLLILNMSFQGRD